MILGLFRMTVAVKLGDLDLYNDGAPGSLLVISSLDEGDADSTFKLTLGYIKRWMGTLLGRILVKTMLVVVVSTDSSFKFPVSVKSSFNMDEESIGSSLMEMLIGPEW